MYFCIIDERVTYRTVIAYKAYFTDFLALQNPKVKEKIAWTLKLIEEIQQVSETYLKHIEETDGLYEVRIQQGSDIFRVFSFFDAGKLLYLQMDFRKKLKKHQKKKLLRHLKLKMNIMKANNDITTLSELVSSEYGAIGTAKRNAFEEGYQNFKLGALVHDARIEKGLTQEQLAIKCGTNKSYISKVENNVKDVRISTLQRIIEVGLGGQLNLSVTL